MDKQLHIISFDVPFPADYGGVIDVYYRIKWLHELGIKIHLHCFTKEREPAEILEKYCISVNYYQRKKLSGISFSLPYIVQSRSDKTLIQKLAEDDHPILAENLHCSYFLRSNLFAGRKIFIRQQNVEYKYYEHLAKNEGNILKKLYFKNESRLLKKYERSIVQKAVILPISLTDTETYQQEFKAPHIHFLPVFLPQDILMSFPGTGKYCLYHGNLSVNENEKAAEWLIKSVFSELKIPLIIAGRSPSEKLKALAEKYKNIIIKADPSENEMLQLVQQAAVNVLPSMNATGVKLKLFNALFNGRHCLVNNAGIEGTGLENVCHVAETAEAFCELVKGLFVEPFTETIMQHRSTALKNLYNNEANARRLIAWIW